MKKVYILILSVFAICACTEEVLFEFDENLARELGELDSFISTHNIPVEVHESEVRYRILREGTGEPFERGDLILYDYQIYLLDSTLIESNLNEVRQANGLNPINNVQGTDVYYGLSNHVRPGYMNVAFELGSEQTRIQMFVPSYMAFGARERVFYQNRIVPPHTPLLVEIEITEVRHPD